MPPNRTPGKGEPRRDDLDWLYGDDSGAAASNAPATSATQKAASETSAPKKSQPPAYGREYSKVPRSAPDLGVTRSATSGLGPAAPPVASAAGASTAASGGGAGGSGAAVGGTGGGSKGGNGGGKRSGGQPPTAPPAAPKRTRRRRRPGRWIAALLVLMLAWLLVVPLLSLARGGRVDATPTGDRPSEQPGTAILLVGSDARENMTTEQRKKYGTGSTAGGRTDTIMILFVPKVGKPALISIPRDSYVTIPGRGKNKINAAYAFGGPKLLVQTVEQATGLRMDGYAEIGMAGFGDLVDAVGGVDVCLDKPMVDKDSKANLPAGCQSLDGVKALSYVRMRKADLTGDLGRMKRQREIMGKISKKVVSPMTFINPIRYWNVNSAAGQTITRSKDTSLWELTQAAYGFQRIGSGKGLTIGVPVSNPNATTSAGSSMIWDEEAAAAMFALLKKGTTVGIEQFVK